MTPRIDLGRLLARLDEFNRIGALAGGGNCRLALTDEDRAGRDLLVQWMRELGLAVTIDAMGNIVGLRAGRENVAPVMFGSHVDTVATGGRYDGLYGVLAGLEACEALDDIGIVTRRPLALVAFTNEEGSRFPPYAMGSLVYVGGLALNDAYASEEPTAPPSAMNCGASAMSATRRRAGSPPTPFWSCISSRGRCWRMRAW